MYKKVTIQPTSLELCIDKIKNDVSRKDISISVYTDEFDLSMLRIFFPEVRSKIGYVKDSLCLVNSNKITRDIVSRHSISIVRKLTNEDYLSEFLDISEKVENFRDFDIFYLKDDVTVYDKESEDNSIVKCNYICTLFPPKEGVDLKKIQITKVGVYSVTSYKSNLETVKIISDAVGKNITILDATACVGGDTIGFAMNFDYVISIEKDPVNYKALVNNVDVYGLDNVSCINKNFIEDGIDIVTHRRPDVVYFDPPWGGKNYHLHDKLDLFLDSKNIKDVVSSILDNVKLIVLKVPSNFNYDNMETIGRISVYKLKKFHIVTIAK